MFDREKQKMFELPIVMWDMRGTDSPKAQTGTNTLTIIVGDVNDNQHYPGHQDVFVYNYKGRVLKTFSCIVVSYMYISIIKNKQKLVTSRKLLVMCFI